ncbi:MAG: LysE family translocator [Alphaproteobacteria bacterium]
MSSLIDFYFVKGFLVGLSVAAPIGPVAIFCIRQTLAFGTFAGLTAGLAVSLADGIYSWLAAYSTSLIEHLMQTYSRWLYLGGGLFLIYLGISVFRSPSINQQGDNNQMPRNLFRSFYKTLLLTFASPMTTLLFIGMFTAYGIFENPINSNGLTSLVGGVFFGALSWWVILAFFVGFIKKHFDKGFFKYINYISGTLITGYGTFTLYKFLELAFFS